MEITVEKDTLLHFKHIHAFESNAFDICDIVQLINRVWKKSFVRRDKNLKAIIDIGWSHLDRSLMKYPIILEKKLDNEQLDNQHDPPLRTHLPIP